MMMRHVVVVVVGGVLLLLLRDGKWRVRLFCESHRIRGM